MRTSRLMIVLLCGLVALAPLAAAQGTTSRVLGTVVDTTGGVLPGASVTLTNERTGVSFTTATSATGTYAFEAVPSGMYAVKVELQGFKTFSAPGIPVEIGQPTTVNARLDPGELAETVTVTAASPVVQTSNSGNLGTVVPQQAIEALPIVGTRGRNPLDLVTLQPGVVSGANTGGGTHVFGARDRSWNFTLDGIDINETSAGGSNFSPLRTNPDSLAEFKVITGNSTAEFGRNSGAQVAMITRSGTNRFRGTGFYFRRQPEFNANEWERNLKNSPPDQFYQDIGGFSLGGPIRRNKTFFFGNLQILRAKIERSVTSTTYTDTARNGIWRYVIGGRNQPYGVAGSPIDAAGNVLPGVAIGTYNIGASDPQKIGLNAEIQRLVGLMPSPNIFTTGDGLNTAGYTFYPLENEEQYDAVVRVDQAFSEKHYVFGRAAWGQQDTICDSVNGGLPPFPGLPCDVNTYRSPLNFAGSWRWNPKSNMVNEAVFGLNYFEFDFQIPMATASSPTYAFSGITMPEIYSYGNARKLRTWQFVDNLSWFTGGHTLKFGLNFRFQQHTDVRGSIAGYNANPEVNFSTAVNTVDPILFGLPTNINTAYDRPALQNHINFLLGRFGQVYQGFVSTGDQYAPGGMLFDFDARYPEMDFFAQDTWRPSSNLTFDLGLRWEMKLTPANPQGLIRRPDVRVAAGEPAASALKWVEGDLYGSDWNNIAPSAGVAWDPKGDGKSVIRGNYRLAYDRINTFVISSSILQSIPGITAGQVNESFGQAGGRLPQVGTAIASLQPTFTPDSFLQPPAVSAASMRVMDTEFSSPMTHGWMVSYQRELMRNTVFEAAYIGRRASSLFGGYNVNQVEYVDNGFLDGFKVVQAGGQSAFINQLLYYDTRRLASETGSDMMRRLYTSNLQLNSVAAAAASIGSRIQSGKTLAELAGFSPYLFFPYTQYLGGLTVIDSTDYSNYHALQLKLERRVVGGYYSFGYTLSRSKDTRSFDPAFTVTSTANAQSASSTPFDIFDRSLNYALSDFDRTHVLNANFATELPFGRGKRFASDVTGVLDQIVSGWEIAGAITWSSGRPFTIYSGSNTFSNMVQTPATCNGCSSSMGGVYDEPTTNIKWYLTAEERAKFGVPGAGEFTAGGRNSLRGPGWFNVNATVAKRFRVVSGHTLEIRADITNLTNTPSFGLPTATYTSTTFGRIYDSVASYSRKMQLGIKYTF